MSDAGASVEVAAGASLVLPTVLGPWRCRRLELTEDGRTLTAYFERSEAADWLEVTVFQDLGGRRALKRLSRCAVSYRVALRDKSAEKRAEIAALVRGVAEAVDARLAERTDGTIADAFGRRSHATKIVFGRSALLRLFSPEIVLGRELPSGFRLSDVYPSSQLREAETNDLVLVLDFRRDLDSRRVLFEVRRRAEDRPALSHTKNFTLMQLSLGSAAPAGADDLATLVSFLIALRDHDGLSVEFPDVLSREVRLLPVASEDVTAEGRDRVLNLAVDTACGQACSFCSVQELSPPVDGTPRLLARLRADLESNRRRGVRRVRFNGYDPLSYDRILDVLEYARELGYQRADLFSPCTRLAERPFCEAVLARLPEHRRIHVPVYGADADAHDGVVGRAGSFALVERALNNLLDLTDAADVRLIAVATKDGLESLWAVADWARRLGVAFSAHMPYPSSESSDDRFFASVPRQSDVADLMARALADGSRITVHGVAPCVTLRRMRAHGVPPASWLDAESSAQPLPGTEYSRTEFVHRAAEAEHSAFRAPAEPCPHVASCALSPACPRELLVGYLKAHGAEEFVPVGVRELLDAES